jgi:hypothetical protein
MYEMKRKFTTIFDIYCDQKQHRAHKCPNVARRRQPTPENQNRKKKLSTAVNLMRFPTFHHFRIPCPANRL